MRTKLLTVCGIAVLALTGTASATVLTRATILTPPFTMPVPTASATAAANGQPTPRNVRFGPRHAVKQLPCRPGDHPETDLQGRVPPVDTATGRAAQGYNCNLEVVGH